MHKHYQQVADKQFGFGVLKAKDNKEEEDGYTVDLNLQKMIYLHRDLPVGPLHIHHMHHDTHRFVNYLTPWT